MPTAPAAISDDKTDVDSDELRHRVQQFLNTRGIHDIKGVHLDVDGGVVVLRGRIASARDHWLCVTCTSRVAGVLHVIDQLDVEDDVASRRCPK